MNVLLDFAPSVLVSLLLVSAAGASTPVAAPLPPPVQLAQVTIEQRVIIRIPIVPQPGSGSPQRGAAAALRAPPPPEPPQAPEIREVKGPKCLKLEQLRGAVLNSATGVTMLTEKDEAFRTHFGKSCRAADFYSGFYIEPNKDGSVCAGRDALHARNGSTCDIEKFTKLVPDD